MVELAILHDVVARTQRINHAQHAGFVTALDGLQRKPGRNFRFAPGNSRGTYLKGRRSHHRIARTWVKFQQRYVKSPQEVVLTPSPLRVKVDDADIWKP